VVIIIDSYDSFTYNLLDYVLQAGRECEVYRDDAINIGRIRELKPEGIILSPGPGRPDDHPLLFEILHELHAEIPMLGVCLGFQAMGEYFGMELKKSPVPRHGKVSNIVHDGSGIFKGLPNPLKVCRYHSLILSQQKGNDFIINSNTEDGLPMSGIHRHLPLWGVQFHPEAILTESGNEMIKNWCGVLNPR
jgi:anthranilate synthase/aminodeoxychorismate synthase-like glutamine amidotransferase